MADARELLEAYAGAMREHEFSGPDCYHRSRERLDGAAPKAFDALRTVLDECDLSAGQISDDVDDLIDEIRYIIGTTMEAP